MFESLCFRFSLLSQMWLTETTLISRLCLYGNTQYYILLAIRVRIRAVSRICVFYSFTYVVLNFILYLYMPCAVSRTNYRRGSERGTTSPESDNELPLVFKYINIIFIDARVRVRALLHTTQQAAGPVPVRVAPARSAVRSHTVQTITAMTRSLGTLVGLRRRCPVFDAYAFNCYIACAWAWLPRGPLQHACLTY